jgi:Flp pilus assembly protein TadD
MRIEIKNRNVRGMLMFLAVASFLLAAGWIVKDYAAQVVARKGSVESLQLAIKLDPNNADYHLTLGALYEYMPNVAQPQKAMEQFQRAAKLDPYDPRVWVNLAASAEFRGNLNQAEDYLQRADYFAPRLPHFQWSIGNFYLLHGDTNEALRHFKVVLEGARQYDDLIFNMAWKASGNPGVILKDLIPHDEAAEFSYLYYLVNKGQYDDTQPVWKRIINLPASFDPHEAAPYINALIRVHKPAIAHQVWTDLEKKGIVHYASSFAGNLVTNGDFEDEMSEMGFDWQSNNADGASATLDTSNFHSPGHSMLVRFNGKLNVGACIVFQYIEVKPSTSYRLQALMRTDGITTDSGPRLEVLDAYDRMALDQYTPDLTGSSNGWTPILLDFRTGRKSELLFLGLCRFPSQKLDNLIAGKVWLDDVRLTPLEK